MKEAPAPGLYDSVLTSGLDDRIAVHQDLKSHCLPMDAEIAPRYLRQHLGHLIERALRSVSSKSPVRQQLKLTNRIIEVLSEVAPDAVGREDGATERLTVRMAL